MGAETPKPGGEPTPGASPAAGAPEPVPPAPRAVEQAAETALNAAQEAVSTLEKEVGAASPGPGSDPAPFQMPSFDPPGPGAPTKGIDLLADVNLNVKIELGRTRMLVEDVLRLSEGAVVELDKLAGDPVDVYVNDRPIARGEVLVLNDNFCVRINEIIKAAGDSEAKAAAARVR